MRNCVFILACFFLMNSVLGQAPRSNIQLAPAVPKDAPKEAKEAKTPPSPSHTLNPHHQVVTEHDVTIKGQKVPYLTTTGTMPVWDEDGKIIASLFYIYY